MPLDFVQDGLLYIRLTFIVLGDDINFPAMNYTLGIACFLLAVIGYGVFLYVRRKRAKRVNGLDYNIPNFLRGNNPISDTPSDFKINPSCNIHPWGKRK